MSVTLSYHPLTREVSQYDPKTTLQSLQYCCKKTIISSLGLKYVQLVNELPLPSDIKGFLSTLTLSDFFINADKIPPEGHSSQCFPAKCMLTNSDVLVRVVSSVTDINPVKPNFLASFEDSSQGFVIETPIKTFEDLITECKTENIKLEENLIRASLLKLVKHLIDRDVGATTHISTKCILVMPNNHISIQITENGDQQSMMPGVSYAVYEAPEVLNNDNPDSKAFVWTVGCILHEALALEPAFHDPSGTNPFQVYMNITNGIIPPTPSDGSEELQNLVEKCLVHNRAGRISLQDLKDTLSGLIVNSVLVKSVIP